MPQRVQDALIAAGDLTPARIGSKPQQRACPSCRTACLAAIPFLRVGAVWLEAWPTTARGELDALLAGRATYAVTNGIEKRDAEYITAVNADEWPHVHVEHSCQARAPAHPEFTAPKKHTFDTPPF